MNNAKMRHLSGSLYTLLVNIIPIIFLCYTDIVSHSAVEARYAASFGLSRSEEDYSEYDSISEARLGKNAPIPKLKKLLRNKTYQRIGFGVAALIVVAIAVKSALRRRNREYMEFLSDLARLKELDTKLSGEVLQLVKVFWKDPDPEFYDLEGRARDSSYVYQMKNQFFQGATEEEKNIKLPIWKNYLYPFFTEYSTRTKRQSSLIINVIKNKLRILGYNHAGLSEYDVEGYAPFKIDEAPLFDIVADLKCQPNRRQDYRRVEYFAENYKRFFEMRAEFMMLREKLFKFMKTKHEDVDKCGFKFARSILAE